MKNARAPKLRAREIWDRMEGQKPRRVSIDVRDRLSPSAGTAEISRFAVVHVSAPSR
jgi:hypothetical protein